MTGKSANVRLDGIAELQSVQVDPRDYADELYIGLEHVSSGRMKRRGGGKASDVQSSKYLFQEGDVLYGKLRPYLDKAIVADINGVCTTELLVLRPKVGVDPRFVVSVVHSSEFLQHALAGTSGAQHPRTSWHEIRTFSFPAFSASEQLSIVDLVCRIETAIDLNERLILATEVTKRTAMRELFTRGLRGEAQKETEIGLVPESWDVRPLVDVAAIERGRFLHRPRNEPRFYGGTTPFVQTGDVVRSAGRIRSFSQSLNEDGVAISRVFPIGTILITIAANIGYTGVLEIESACPDSLVGISPRDGIDVYFLEYFLQTQQSLMDRNAPKGTQKNINIQFLNPWPVPLPTLAEQREISTILDTIDRKIDLHKRKRAVLESLFKSLLHKLMTGEIRVADLNLSALESQVTAGVSA